MSEELVKWDPAAIKEKIAQSIRAAYLQFIPEEAWQALVDAEVKAFITDKRVMEYVNGYGQKEVTKPAPLKVLIRDQVKDIFQTMLKDELAKPEYVGVWDGSGNGRNLPGEAVKKIIVESIPALIEGMWGDIVQRTVMAIRNQRP